MIKKTVIIAWFVIFLLGAGFSHGAAGTLTLDEAINLAMEKNPTLSQARQSKDQAYYALQAAWSRALPTLSAGGTYQRMWDKPEFVIPLPEAIFGPNAEIRSQTGADHTLTGSVVLEQPIFTGGAIWSGIGIARDGLAVAEWSLSAARQQTLETVYSAFYGVLLAQSLLSVAETAVQNAEVNLHQVDKRYQEGAASRFELLRAQVQLATVRPQRTEAKNTYDVAQERLKDLLGLDKGHSIDIRGNLEPRPKALPLKDLDALIVIAYEHRPEYRMQQLQKGINEKRIHVARAEFLPTVALSSAVQWQALREDLHFGHSDFERTSYAALTLRIPLFNGFGSRARLHDARLELKKSEIQSDDLKNLIATEIRLVHHEVTQADEILQSQKQVVEQAREGLRLANLLYAEGAATLLEVIDAQLAFTQASSSYFRAIYNFNTASVRLEKGCGILTTDSILDNTLPEAP